MYQTHKTYIRPGMKMLELINDNPLLLIFLEHFNIDFAVGDKTVEQICMDSSIDRNVFIMIANLYNGFMPSVKELEATTNLNDIINFLKNSHKYYKDDKYPEISTFIEMLGKKHDKESINMIKEFFIEYFNEVLEHLEYEDETVFPYFSALSQDGRIKHETAFSVEEYREHHTDIETKLTDLKNLLLKHISVKNELPLRRRLLISLFELEYDLHIHSMIEEKILLPLVERLEGNK